MEKLDLESFTRKIVFVGGDRTGNSRFCANACGGRKDEKLGFWRISSQIGASVSPTFIFRNSRVAVKAVSS